MMINEHNGDYPCQAAGHVGSHRLWYPNILVIKISFRTLIAILIIHCVKNRKK